jgi:intracellular multiplication protein IcmB
MAFVDPILDSVDSILQWLSSTLKQTTAAYCQLETSMDEHTLVGRDGSLVTVFALDGSKIMVGAEEFDRLHQGIAQTLQAAMSRPGHSLQVLFSYDLESVKEDIKYIVEPAWQTARRLQLDLDDLFLEKVNYLSNYCAKEQCYFVLWTMPTQLNKQQLKAAAKRKTQEMKEHKIPPMQDAQGLFAALLDLKESHQSFAKAILNDFVGLQLSIRMLDVHEALARVRQSVDPEFTEEDWTPYLPGDMIPARAKLRRTRSSQDISEIMWPPLNRQLIPRDAEILNLHTARIGDRIYAPIFIELFPKEIKVFNVLLQRLLATKIPWRVSFFIESGGLGTLNVKSMMAGILSFANRFNPLINDAKQYLSYLATNTDDSVVRLRVSFATWAPADRPELLRTRLAELAKAVQGWGNCDIGEISGDSVAGTLSSALAINTDNVGTPSVAPLSDVIKMLPVTRPASPWRQGAILFRSPDGKPWPYQPGSSQQTTWIDIIYARPGSGKSVLSNAINLALCLMGGLERLPRIAIVDIGPSSSGLISLLKEALPKTQRHLVMYQRMRMTPEFSVNPFDTQLGCRQPTPQERSFLVNFLSLLATPVGADRPYDGITDMAGMVVDELYKQLKDESSPNRYVAGLDRHLDECLEKIHFHADTHSTWWEITDALFSANMVHEAMLAQRYAVPLLADATSVCRAPAVDDLFGKIVSPTGESLVESFSRMISSALREYPILSKITAFDLGDARVISLDLDEVAKSGGEAADRQTAVMYMVARYILGRHYYLTPENLGDMPVKYREYHRARITEIREDPKRLVFDEFHRTSKAKAVRDQILVDMREGRKWKVQVALLSQSVEDFDETMIEFATSVFVMDAGPVTAIQKSTKIFGLSATQQQALRTQVHGPRAGGGTCLAQFSTKSGLITQLVTNTLGPIELWAFSTTAEDARVRNELYDRIGPKNARKVLAHMFPGGSLAAVVEQRLMAMKDSGDLTEESGNGVLSDLIQEIIKEFQNNPMFRSAKAK